MILIDPPREAHRTAEGATEWVAFLEELAVRFAGTEDSETIRQELLSARRGLEAIRQRDAAGIGPPEEDDDLDDVVALDAS